MRLHTEQLQKLADEEDRAMSIRTATALCLLTLVSVTAGADEVRAVLTHVTGAPMVYELSTGEARHVSMVAPGRSYSLPLEVATGQADSATFALPNSLIEVSANSMMRIVAPEPGTTSVMQRVLQRAGSVLFRVHKGTLERFQVETPFLVSVVKGTVFNVLVREDGATVSLQEGRLQVNSVVGDQSVELRPGDVAFSGPDGALHVLDVRVADGAPTPRVEGPSVANRDDSLAEGLVVDDAENARSAGEVVMKRVAEPVAVVVAAPEASVVTPVVGAVVSPVVEAVVSPVVDTVAAPVIDTLVDPVVNLVVAPTVDTLVDPLGDVVDPLVTPVDAIVPDGAVAMVDTVAAPLIDPIVPVLEPILPDAVVDVVGQTAGGSPLGGVVGRLF